MWDKALSLQIETLRRAAYWLGYHHGGTAVLAGELEYLSWFE